MNNRQPEKPGGPPFIQIILVTIAVTLAILGQILLYTTPINNETIWPTAAWISIAAIPFFALIYFYRLLPLPKKISLSFPANKGPWVWFVLASLASILATVAAVSFEKYFSENYIPVVSIWLIGAFCYLMAFVPAEPSPKIDWKQWLYDHRKELLVFGVIVLLAAILRFTFLGQYPRVIDGDEGRIGEFAQATKTGSMANPFTFFENIGSFYLQAINLAITIFGTTPFALRLLPAIAGTLSIIAVYLFARQVGGQRVAILAATILSFSHTHIHFSRISAVTYIQGTWLVPLEMYLFLSGLEKRSSWRTALSGILLAVHMQIYISAQIMTGVLFVYSLLALLLYKDSLRAAWRQVLVFWGGFLLTFLPGLVYIYRHPAEFFSRMAVEGTFRSGWLSQEIILTGKPVYVILFQRVVHVFLSLIYYPTISFYGSPTPALSLISAALLLFGITHALIKTRSPKMLLLNGYFWGTLLAIGIFAIPPDADTYRILIALPAACILVTLGLLQLLDTLGLNAQRQPWHYAATLAIVVVNLIAFNLYTYYFDFIGQCRYGGDPQTRFASYLGNYVRSTEKEVTIYLLSDDIFQYGSHSSVDFLTQKRPIINHPESIDTLQPISGEIIVANPGRVKELQLWIREHPGGKLHSEYDCKNLILLSYRLP